MKVVYTDEALRDLDEILVYIASHYPTISSSFEKRLRTVVTRIGSSRRAHNRSKSVRACAWCR